MTQPDNPATIKPQATSHKPSSVLVSVIIPAYNTARYIHRAIESCLRQTHTNIEILIINDGSIDDTLEVARSYVEKDSRIRVFTQENAGVSVARNVGIREARGEYLVFLDSDDWMEDNALEVMLEAQIANPGRLIGTNYWFVFDNKERPDVFARTKAISAPSRELTLEETVYAQTSSAFPVSAWAKIFSADIIREHGLRFREGVHSGEDIFFALEYLVRTGGSVYVDTPLYDYYLGRTLPYSRKTNTEDWYLLDLDSPNLTPKVRKALRFSLGKASVGYLAGAVTSKMDSEHIRARREKAKPFIRELLTSKHLTFPRKVYTLIAYYFPVPLARLIISFWQSHKSTPARRTKEDSIPRW